MGIKSVRFISYDINTQNQAPRIETNETPNIYFLPAYRKNPPYLRFLGNPKMSEIGNFVKKNADIKFTLSQDLAQVETFQEMQIKNMIEEQQRKDSMQMIEDELRRRGEL